MFAIRKMERKREREREREREEERGRERESEREREREMDREKHPYLEECDVDESSSCETLQHYDGRLLVQLID